MFLIIKYIQMVGLYFIYQRYDFESKSQLYNRTSVTLLRCISYTKGTTLKANHNYGDLSARVMYVVFHIPKVRL